MWLIGLTGGSGSGKTTAAKLFADYGIAVIDADEVARFVVRPNASALVQIAQVFGKKYLHEDGTLNRSMLGSLVFSDSSALAQLNRIMIPEILNEIQLRIKQLQDSGEKIALLDAPLLFEYQLDAICNSVVLMSTPLDIRIERLMKRDGLTEEEVKRRIQSQIDYSAYEDRVDYRVDATDAFSLQKAVFEIVNDLQGKAKL